MRDALTVWQFAPLVSAVLALTAAMYLARMAGRPAPSGPVITLTGETDLVSVAQLSALVSAQLSGGTVTVEGPHELGSPYGGSIPGQREAATRFAELVKVA